MPHPSRIREVSRTSRFQNGDPVVQLEIEIEDPSMEQDFFELAVLDDERWRQIEFTILNPELQDQLDEYSASTIIEADLQRTYVPYLLFHDRPLDGRTLTLIVETYPSFAGVITDGSLTVKVRSVSRAYYDYWRTAYLQGQSGADPFGQPVNILSNVRDGHGVFAGYSSAANGELTDLAMHDEVAGLYSVDEYMYGLGDGAGSVGLAGVSGRLELFPNGVARGNVELRFGGGDVWSANLNGGFVLRRAEVMLIHSAESAFRDMVFRYDPRFETLTGVLSESRSQGIQVTLTKD